MSIIRSRIRPGKDVDPHKHMKKGCPKCEGTGFVGKLKMKCRPCHGKGYTYMRRKPRAMELA